MAYIMDKAVFDLAMERVMKVKLEAIERFENEFINPVIDELRNPEKVLGKKYEEWTPEDFKLAGGIYQPMPDILEQFVASREYESMVQLHKQEEING